MAKQTKDTIICTRVSAIAREKLQELVADAQYNSTSDAMRDAINLFVKFKSIARDNEIAKRAIAAIEPPHPAGKMVYLTPAEAQALWALLVDASETR